MRKRFYLRCCGRTRRSSSTVRFVGLSGINAIHVLKVIFYLILCVRVCFPSCRYYGVIHNGVIEIIIPYYMITDLFRLRLVDTIPFFYRLACNRSTCTRVKRYRIHRATANLNCIKFYIVAYRFQNVECIITHLQVHGFTRNRATTIFIVIYNVRRSSV